MRNDLYGVSEIAALPFPVQDAPVDFSGRDRGGRAQGFVGEAFVMSQIQIRFRPVVGHEDFPVLIGAHRPRIHVQIRVEFLILHLIASGF